VSNPTDSAIDQLAALQQIDCRLREKIELMQQLEREVADLEHRLAAQRQAAQAAQAERDIVEARRRELEAHLETEEAKMKDRRMRLNRVRNEKELQALRREIEVGKDANQQVEEQLLAMFESLDALNANARESAQALADLESSAQASIVERRNRISALSEETVQERERRDQMATQLDTSLRQKYEQIFERRGGTAVVEVRNGTCLGCHMNLPPQFFNELQRGHDVRLCPNCHRILYWRPERLEAADTSR
jgi:predicted  nucleic acid-binding Zn-ribbon protein